MKYLPAHLFRRLLIAFAITQSVSLLPAAPLPAHSTISAVTVYTDRAIITRTASVDLTATGPVEVTFDKLPAGLLDQSLQVSGRGAAQAVILDVTTRHLFTDTAPAERVRALEDQLQALAKERRGLDDRTKLLESQRASLVNTEAALFSPASKDVARPTIAEVTTALTFLNDQRTKISTEIAALDDQRTALASKVIATQQQLDALHGSAVRTTKTVVVRLDAATTGKLDLDLSYAVFGANWTPSYDARVNSNEKTIGLAYQGIVQQNTGEDWKDVALTLSTAQPSLGGAAPEQHPWTLDVIQPIMYGGAGKTVSLMARGKVARPDPTSTIVGLSPGGQFAPQADGLAARAETFDAGVAQASVDQAATSASFKLATPASIPSDNSPQKVPITTAALTATLEYLTTPKLRAAAFLSAKVVNSSDFPLLAGTLNVFLDGTFVATSSLRTVMSGEKFDLALGVDEGLGVKHKRVQRFTEDTGLTNSGKRVTYEYLLTIQNNKKVPAHVVVSDQVPVSRNERIVVKQLTPDPKENKPTSDGTLKWTLDLKPGEKRDLTVKFTVDHPNDIQVAGFEP